MIKLLSTEEQQTLHNRYRKNDLFRHWSGILCQLESEMDEIDAISLWFVAEDMLQRLKGIKKFRDEEIPYQYKELLNECSSLLKGEVIIHRSKHEAERSAVTIMCLILTSLMNAVVKGHEEEDFENKAMCVAIERLLGKNPYYIMLMNSFFKRKTWNDGKKVIITPSDPMKIIHRNSPHNTVFYSKNSEKQERLSHKGVEKETIEQKKVFDYSQYDFIIKENNAEKIITKLHALTKGKSAPKDKMMPIRAAMDAGVIRRPTFTEIQSAFGENFIANSSYHNYTNPDKQPFQANAGFLMLVTEFKKLVE